MKNICCGPAQKLPFSSAEQQPSCWLTSRNILSCCELRAPNHDLCEAYMCISASPLPPSLSSLHTWRFISFLWVEMLFEAGQVGIRRDWQSSSRRDRKIWTGGGSKGKGSSLLDTETVARFPLCVPFPHEFCRTPSLPLCILCWAAVIKVCSTILLLLHGVKLNNLSLLLSFFLFVCSVDVRFYRQPEERGLR